MFSLVHHNIHNRDPFFDRMGHYHRLRREMDDLLTPAMIMLNTMGQPRTILPKGDRFEVKMDVQQFHPEELNIKLVDNYMIIEGKHEEKQDEHGYISRQFSRRYLIPDDVKKEEISCDLSSDGVLMLTAPRHIEQPLAAERKLPINFTGQPAAITNPTMTNNNPESKKLAKGNEACAELMTS